MSFFSVNIADFSVAGDLTIIQCLLRLGTAFILTFFLSYIYKMINSKKQDRYVIMQSIIFISVILAGAMMVIGNNLAIAFGLVGAVSIIRFRATVGNFFDMSFLFVAIVVGMASGLGFHFLAFIIAFIVGILMLILNYFKFGKMPPSLREYEVTIIIEGADIPQKIFYEFLTSTAGPAGAIVNFIEFKSQEKKKKFKFSIFIDTNQDLTETEKLLEEKLKDLKYEINIETKK